jgi:hypothetical protein
MLQVAVMDDHTGDAGVVIERPSQKSFAIHIP